MVNTVYDNNSGIFFLFLLKKLCCGAEALLICTHNIGFYGELVKIVSELSPNILLNKSSESASNMEYAILTST